MKEKSSLPKYFFDWKGALALIFGAIGFLIIPATANVISMNIFHTNYEYQDSFMLVMNTLQWIGAIWAFDYFVCRPQTRKKLNFNFSTKNFYTYVLIFPLMFGMMLIAEFITGKIPIKGPFFGEMYKFFSQLMDQMTQDTSVLIVMAVIMAPIFEEIVFRGIIQKGLINKGVKPMSAIWISALVFGLVHGNPWQFVGAVLLGFVLGLVYYKTKSLLLPMLLHAFNNGVSTLLIYYHKTESFADAFHVSHLLILGIGIVIFTVFYFLFMKKYRVHYSES